MKSWLTSWKMPSTNTGLLPCESLCCSLGQQGLLCPRDRQHTRREDCRASDQTSSSRTDQTTRSRLNLCSPWEVYALAVAWKDNSKWRSNQQIRDGLCTSMCSGPQSWSSKPEGVEAWGSAVALLQPLADGICEDTKLLQDFPKLINLPLGIISFSHCRSQIYFNFSSLPAGDTCRREERSRIGKLWCSFQSATFCSLYPVIPVLISPAQIKHCDAL